MGKVPYDRARHLSCNTSENTWVLDKRRLRELGEIKNCIKSVRHPGERRFLALSSGSGFEAPTDQRPGGLKILEVTELTSFGPELQPGQQRDTWGVSTKDLGASNEAPKVVAAGTVHPLY